MCAMVNLNEGLYHFIECRECASIISIDAG